MATTPDYTVNYEDERFTDITDDKQAKLSETDRTYGEMISDVDAVYGDLKEATEQWKNTQTDIQNQQTDFTIQQIEQQKDQLQKDYSKEQAGAYVDWRKQSNQYGAEAEKMASAGLARTGYSESSQVSMYNTYQNRVAVARESFQQAWTSYNNKITEAKLQNNAAIAEIALQAFEKQAEYSLQAFQYKNQLVLDLFDKKLEVERFYDDKWYRELDQVNTENAMAEQIRQYNETQKWQTEQAELDRAFQTKRDELERAFTEKQNELNRKHDKDMLAAKTEAEKKLAEEEHKRAMEKLAKQHEYDKAILDKQLANEKAATKYKYDLENSSKSASFSTGSSGSSGSRSAANYSDATKRGYAIINSYDNRNTNYAVNTAYYQGAKNPDAEKYGTFSNGYQPKGISGHGKLSKTSKTITVSTVVKYGVDKGKKQNLVQTVWKAKDGTKWYWEGRQNKYIQIK